MTAGAHTCSNDQVESRLKLKLERNSLIHSPLLQSKLKLQPRRCSQDVGFPFELATCAQPQATALRSEHRCCGALCKGKFYSRCHASQLLNSIHCAGGTTALLQHNARRVQWHANRSARSMTLQHSHDLQCWPPLGWQTLESISFARKNADIIRIRWPTTAELPTATCL